MVFLERIRIPPISGWDRGCNGRCVKIFLGLLVLVLVLVILICLFGRFNNSNAYLEGFTIANKLIVPNADAMQILQKGIMNNEELTRIIQGKLDKFASYDLINIEKTRENIPKIIHFIWVGSQLPEKYIDNINTYIDNNPNYEIWIWHDNNTHLDKVSNLHISTGSADSADSADSAGSTDNSRCKMQNINQIQFTNALGINKMQKWAGKADIIRYEIIYNYGGMYIDVDSRSIKAFDDNFANSYVCIESDGIYNNLSNAQFGFDSKNPLLHFVIKCLQENISNYLNQYGKLEDILSICGPPFFTTCFYWWMKRYEKYPIKFINQTFTISNNDFSYNYHTNDKNW